MISKILATVKAMVVICLCMFVPIWIASKFMTSAMKKDAAECIDSFVNSECGVLAKNVSIQFENTQKELQKLVSRLRLEDFAEVDKLDNTLKSYVKKNSNILSIKVYEKDGAFVAASTENEDEPSLTVTEAMRAQKDNVMYQISQLDDGKIVMSYTFLKKMYLNRQEVKKYYIEVVEKWDQYEQYMDKLQAGVFPRMMYIVSPGCKRYVSFNSLPPKSSSKQDVVALGLHLTDKIDKIANGTSTVEVDSRDFRICKYEIKFPPMMTGERFYMIISTDDRAIETMLNNLSSGLPTSMLFLVIVLLLFTLAASRFYSYTREQLEISSTITESTPLAVLIFHFSDGKILQSNQSAKTLLRIDPAQEGKINVWDVFIDDSDKEYLMRATGSNISALNYEVLVQSFGGASFWSICSASPIDINDEKYVVLAVMDINSRKEIEKKLANNAALLEKQIAERTADLEEKTKQLEQSNGLLEKAKAEADNANAAKSKFLTSISNELKTPLNAIIGYSEILQEEAQDRKDNVSADDLRKIIGAAKHLLSLIEEILDLSMIEAGKVQLSLSDVNISDVIKDVEGVTLPLVANKDNSLFLEYPKDIGNMFTDATKVRQCLLNLLSNAAKFTEFGKITLRVTPMVSSGEDFVEFSVTDTGSGIAPERLETIFESFQDEKGKNSGAGLGLSITKRYAEYLGGSVSVNSELGVGSKFSFKIPRTCRVESNEFIEIKDPSKEVNDEFDEEGDFGGGATTFARKSDQHE